MSPVIVFSKIYGHTAHYLFLSYHAIPALPEFVFSVTCTEISKASTLYQVLSIAVIRSVQFFIIGRMFNMIVLFCFRYYLEDYVLLLMI